MSPKEMYVNLEEMRRLQQRMTRISEDTNLLRQQFNGQVNSWSGVPSWGSITSAQQLLERLTREAEALSDLPRNVIAGLERVGQENERNRGVWANGLAALSRLLGTQARRIGFVAHVSSAMRRAATHLVSRITNLPGRESWSKDPVIRDLTRVVNNRSIQGVRRLEAVHQQVQRARKQLQELGRRGSLPGGSRFACVLQWGDAT